MSCLLQLAVFFTMVAFPPSKINLGLRVLEKRSDGYHNLDTCFYPIPLTDVLEILPAETLKFIPTGTAIPGSDHDNLCLKAYRLLDRDFKLPPVEIHLHKVIPTGAGLGGGSSDGAHTLRLLNEIFSLQISHERLSEYASVLGSDCAFFVRDKPALGSGRGEILEPADVSLTGKYLMLIKPEVHVSTAEAYGGIVPGKPTVSVREIVEQLPLEKWRDVLVNDFETSVFSKHPIIEDCKAWLYEQGAVYASMSGSGASVFGLFNAPAPVVHPNVIWQGILS